MLSKVSLEHIQKGWPTIAQSIAQFLPPTVLGSEKQIDYIFNALMLDKMHLWMYIKDNENYAVIITKYTGEIGIEVNNLLIYAFIRFKELTDDIIADGFKTLKDFAKSHECAKIIAYTNIDSVVDMFKNLGGQADYVLLTMEV
jgi:hypothetical protein